MYKLLLILKYLRKRRIAWVSLLAVTLCTAMVLVVISVMGGWLTWFRESFHGLSGDVIVKGESLVGFPHYQEMIDRIRRLPQVKNAAPVLHTFGLVNIGNQISAGVQVMGYPADIGSVNQFTRSLHRGEGADKVNFDLLADVPYESFVPDRLKHRARSFGGMIVGSGVIGLKKNTEGEIDRPNVMYHVTVTLEVLPISPDNPTISAAGGTSRNLYWIVDDSRTQVYLYDSNTVYVPFEQLQKDLDMEERDGRPARTSDIQVSLKDGADPNLAAGQIRQVVDQVIEEKGIGIRFPITVKTWEQVHATWIGAVEKEKILVTFLFAMISVVAVFLIFCIFYMIVVEKTRDIGIIKSVGATSTGVAAIFLGYGAAIGIVGAGMGLLFGWLIVHNINYLHTKMGQLMGVQIWNPEVYLFDTIPNRMNPREVVIIVSAAVLSSVLGAVIPALRAARLNPVESLRWE